jgi:hypothetical protein
MTTRISIDPNVRVRGNDTFVGLEDVTGPLTVGREVEVYEEEADVVGVGYVTEIDVTKSLVFLSVNWSSLQDASAVATAPVPSVAAISQPGLLLAGRPVRSVWAAATMKLRNLLTVEQAGSSPTGQLRVVG